MDKKNIIDELKYMKEGLRNSAYVLNRIIKELEKENERN